jgi:CO dehydrogenase maturation factor
LTRLTLKLAVAGKGGSGKTVLVSLLARALAERGLMVLAADLDANPGLAVSLGLPPSDAPLPDDAVEEDSSMPYGWGLARHLTAAEAVRRYAAPAGERVFFVGFGNTAGVRARVTRHLTAVRQIVETFDDEVWAVVADLSSGPNDAFEGYARFASPAIVAVEPTATSILTAERLLRLLDHDGTPSVVVGTKVGKAHDRSLLREHFDCVAFIPLDPQIRSLEQEGSLARLATTSPALEAVRRLTDHLMERAASTPSRGRAGAVRALEIRPARAST